MAKVKTILDFFTSPKAKQTSPSGEKKNGNSKLSSTPKISENLQKPSTKKKESKQPKTHETPKSISRKSSSSSGKRALSADNSLSDHSENDNKNEESFSKKRRRIVIESDSDDSEDSYKPDKKEESEDSAQEMSSEVDSDEEDLKPKKKAKKTNGQKQNKLKNGSSKKPTPKAKSSLNLSVFESPKTSSKLNLPSFESPKTPSTLNLSSFQSPKTSSTLNLSSFESPKTPNTKEKKEKDVANTSISEIQDEKEWTHLSLDWLRDDKIMDKHRRLKSDPKYDPRTLYVPEAFKKNCTPAMRQWWEMKVDHYDTILFFKVGKFYELYHMDAVVGYEDLGLSYMKGEFAHSGFPEISYGRFADRLVQKNFKVARVEQTENPQMMEERCRQLSKPTKFDKVVTREICQITSKGTRVFTIQDGEPMAASNSYFIAITEKSYMNGECTMGETEYGVCFIDTSVGKFHIGQFFDDRHRSRLRTLVSHHPPSEIIYERDAISKKTLQILIGPLSNIKSTAISTSCKYWDAARTLKYLVEQKYFLDSVSTDVVWPEPIQNMLDEEDRLQETPKKESELAMRAFAAVVSYLKECLIDDQLLTMKSFEKYIPLDDIPVVESKSFHRQYMVLDGVTLSNLEVLNTADPEGTLFQTVDFCSTNFGKRLLHQWLCSPLCDPKSINDRLDAVEDLSAISDIINDITPLLTKLPDLDRLLSRIHAQGLARSKAHPDTRAIFYEEESYSKRKISDFISTLDGFKCCNDIISLLESSTENFKSIILKQILSFESEEGFYPVVEETLDYFDSAFDHKLAKANGCIIPSKNIDPVYDSAVAEAAETQEYLEEYLNKQKKKFQCKVTYFGSGRNRYQLEVPDHAAGSAGSSYELQSQRKGFKRFYTTEIKEMLSSLTAAEERRDAALLDIMRRIFEKFDQSRDKWKSIVQCISTLDVFTSLMLYKKSCPVTMCRPEIVIPDKNTKPFLKILEGRHPTLIKTFSGDNYIPNNVYLGPVQEKQEEDINRGGNIAIVTGPNMGGKSTLMRQTGLIILLAQLGSFVPAKRCCFTPVDRIFTRLGASDRINAGESTFFVEVSETACILQHATTDSLVLIDELGRGTSTFDGTAIACAVVDELANRKNCRTLFSTHYHSLVGDFVNYPTIGLGHMACMVDEEDNHPALERITFLYKFMDGVCPKSYGFNVAHLAGIPEEIVQRAYTKAKELEKGSKKSKKV